MLPPVFLIRSPRHAKLAQERLIPATTSRTLVGSRSPLPTEQILAPTLPLLLQPLHTRHGNSVVRALRTGSGNLETGAALAAHVAE